MLTCRPRATPTEVAQTLLVVMRYGSLSATKEITGYKDESIGQWLRAATTQTELITTTLVHNLCFMAIEVDEP